MRYMTHQLLVLLITLLNFIKMIRGNNEKDRVCIIGSGNWGSAISKIIGQNCKRYRDLFEESVKMWVYEELIDGEKLTDVINRDHENVKYLSGIKLPENVKAVPDLKDALVGATVLIFVLPHQFLPRLFPVIKDVIIENKLPCRGVSLIKGGFDLDETTKRPLLLSQQIEAALSSPSSLFKCGVLMGANVASEVAAGQVCESTLACNFGSSYLNEKTRLLFHAPSFRVQHIDDVIGAEVCGSLKNVIALGAGFIDGLSHKYGGNTKAALLRVGLLEMKAFRELCFATTNNIDNNTATLLESCGVADLITTCYGGRNRKCAEVFARELSSSGRIEKSTTDECEKRWSKIESEMLNGQKLQGTLTAKEVFVTLRSLGKVDEFPLMKTIYEIAFCGKSVEDIAEGIVVLASQQKANCKETNGNETIVLQSKL